MFPSESGNESPHLHPLRGFRRHRDLTFFIKGITRRFPDRTPGEILDAIERAMEEIAPSRRRILLQRKTIEILNRNPASER